MKIKIALLLHIFLVLLPNSYSGSTYAQTLDPLPSDIIFSAARGDIDETMGYDYFNILARVDARTQEVNQFYIDENAALLKPLDWSPDGNLLAVLRLEWSEPKKVFEASVCIVTASGELQTCADHRLSSSFYPSLTIHSSYAV